MRNIFLVTTVVVSLIANGVLFFVNRTRKQEPAAPPSQAATNASSMQAAWNTLRGKDLATFVSNLRAAGVSPLLLRSLVDAEIERSFQAREEALRPRKKLKFWQRDDAPVSIETSLALLDLKREKAKMRTLLFGNEPTSTDNAYSFVSAPSRDLVRAIKEDYDTMITALRNQAGFSPTAAERDQIQYLEREKQRELGEHLSKAEIAELEMRTSPLTTRLREYLRNFDVTEQEFRDIFTARQQLDRYNRIAPGEERNSSNTRDEYLQREADQARIKAELKATLGAERYAAYLRSQEFEYMHLVDLTRRTGVPESLAVQAFALRDSISTESNRIHDDSSLTYENKRAALKALSDKTRAQIIAILGINAGEAYANASPWLKDVAKGGAVTFRERGRSIRSLPQDAVDD